jgi:hypothetical protein
MLHFFSGEFLLNSRSNSGSVVLVRSLFIALLVYIGAIALKCAIDPSTNTTFRLNQLRIEVVATIPWFGAIFTGIYVALYARFASQWSYLAGIYNDMMASAVQNADAAESLRVMHLWQAGFVEDADDLHLAQQPLFAAVIKEMLAKTAVRDNFVNYSSGGEPRYLRLKKQVDQALAAAALRHQ